MTAVDGVDDIALVGGDGSPLLQGRSLIYRFAAAAPYWVGAMAQVPSIPAGRLRHAASAVVGHFADHGAPDERGLLTLGWHHEWRQLAQSYSGPGSPYWAVKGMLGIALPADHPAWAAPAEPLPVETRDELRVVRPAGWVVSGTRADGLVRVDNHGTDHGIAGDLVGDSPLYTRFGYSTATSPLLDDAAWTEPLEQSVALLDAAGNATHRAGMQLLGTRLEDGVAVAASTWAAHWLTPAPQQQRHGSGLAGEIDVAGELTAVSLVRGPWEVRLVRVDALKADVAALRIGGWPVAGEAPAISATDTSAAAAHTDRLTSRITAVAGTGTARCVVRRDASPLGAAAAVPVIEFPVEVGPWVAVLVELSGAASASDREVSVEISDRTVRVAWPDGHASVTDLGSPIGT